MKTREKNYLKLSGATSIWAFFNGYLVASVSNKKYCIPTASGTGFGMWTGIVGALVCSVNLLRETIVRKKNPFGGLSRKGLFVLVALGIACGINNVFQYTAMSMNAVANVALVHCLAQPISVIYLRFLGEKLRPLTALAVVLGFLGVAVIALKNGQLNFELWFVYALLSANFNGGEIFFSTWLGNLKVNEQLSAFFKLIFQVPTMYIGAKLMHEALVLASGTTILKAILGGLLLYISFVFVFGSVGTKPPKVSGIRFGVIGYIDRLGAVLIGILVFHESPSPNVWIGGALIVIAQLIVILTRKEEGKTG